MRSFSHLEAAAFERLNETVKKARAMASEVNVMSKEQLYMYLKREGLDSDVIETLRSNKISGSSFLELASEYVNGFGKTLRMGSTRNSRNARF